MNVRLAYVISLPERCIRAAFAVAGGTVHESAQLLLPRFVRRSRLYEATAKNALRIAIELLGGVEPRPSDDPDPPPAVGRIAAQKAVGNAVELGTIAAFGFSPLWLLAAAADVLNGSRVYLRTLEDELTAAGVLRAGTRFSSLDDLMSALGSTAGHTGLLIDLPPLEVQGLKLAVAELRADISSLPTLAEMSSLFNALVAMAREERRSLLEVSSGVGLAFLASARRVGREHVVQPYSEDWRPLRDEGFGAYASRIARPYGSAARGHFGASRATVTDRVARSLGRWARAARLRLRPRP